MLLLRAWQESNLRHPEPESGALSPELHALSFLSSIAFFAQTCSVAAQASSPERQPLDQPWEPASKQAVASPYPIEHKVGHL